VSPTISPRVFLPPAEPPARGSPAALSKKSFIFIDRVSTCSPAWLLSRGEGAHLPAPPALTGSGHLLKKEVRSSSGVNYDSSISFNGGCLKPAEFLAYCLSRKKKNYSGEKNSLIVHFIFQFLREFITATKLMLTLELMQQDAKCFQLP